MSQDDRFIDRLRGAFTSPDEPSSGGVACPPPETLWDAFHGDLPAETRREVVAHLVECPECASLWSILVSSEPKGTESPEKEAARAGPVSRFRQARWIFPLAAAAGLTGLAILWGGQVWSPKPELPVYRAQETPSIHSLLPEDRPLHREQVLLRWTAAGPGARYTLDITAPDLAPLVTTRGLTGTEFRVPTDALAKIPPGGTILWRVEARLPDGRKVISSGFRNQVQ